MTASAEEGFSKIWARMQDWERKRYTDMYRVWKGILARNTGGIRENPQFFFYAIRELTATRSGSGIRQKLKENGFRDRDDRRSGYGIVVKERGNTGSGSLPPTSSLLVYSNPGSLQNIPLTNQTTYTYKPAQLSLKFHSTNRSLQCKYNPLRLFLGY